MLSGVGLWMALLTALAIVLCAIVPSASARVHGREVTLGFDESIDPNNDGLQTQIGARIRRIGVGWNTVQPSQGTWNWQSVDEQYASLRAKRLRPLFVPQVAPCWAHPSHPCLIETDDTPPDPAFDGAWAEFNRRLAARYKHLAGIEVWNEPNFSAEFRPAPDPVRYTAMLRAAYPAIKSARPHLPVITGGLFASPVSGPEGMADGDFLKKIYKAGAKHYMDGIGFHPYPVAGGYDGTPGRYEANQVEVNLARIRAARQRFHDTKTPIWITETGESTQTQPGSPPAASEAQQAADLKTILRALKRDGDVKVVIIHRMIDRPLTLGGLYSLVEAGFGVFRVNGTPKPAACVLSRAFHGSLVC
jgi:hypothetical protein